MKLSFNGFEFEGSMEELRFAFPFITGKQVTTVSNKSVPSVQENEGEKKNPCAKYRGAIVMQVKSTMQPTMIFRSMKEAAAFLNRPDSSGISNSCRRHLWTKSNREGDKTEYMFWTVYDAKHKFPSVYEKIFKLSTAFSMDKYKKYYHL